MMERIVARGEEEPAFSSDVPRDEAAFFGSPSPFRDASVSGDPPSVLLMPAPEAVPLPDFPEELPVPEESVSFSQLRRNSSVSDFFPEAESLEAELPAAGEADE